MAGACCESSGRTVRVGAAVSCSVVPTRLSALATGAESLDHPQLRVPRSVPSFVPKSLPPTRLPASLSALPYLLPSVPPCVPPSPIAAPSLPPSGSLHLSPFSPLTPHPPHQRPNSKSALEIRLPTPDPCASGLAGADMFRRSSTESCLDLEGNIATQSVVWGIQWLAGCVSEMLTTSKA